VDRLAVPFGLSEENLQPVYADFRNDPHFIAFGDSASGKTGLLRTLAAGIMADYTPAEATFVVIDYRREMFDAVSGDHPLAYAGVESAAADHIAAHAEELTRRLPGPGVTAHELRTRSWWTGPELFVLVDDYELVATQPGNPLTPLLQLLSSGRDIGLHLVIARSSIGAYRGLFEPVILRLREMRTPGLVMSGSKDEGALLGAVKPGPQPPGRGVLVHRRSAPVTVQVAWTPPAFD
jgi:S-DNA-T family DNA segregation ATPase FtsK/SpoIIIE